jgi:hypothetical protein
MSGRRTAVASGAAFTALQTASMSERGQQSVRMFG